MIFEGLITTLDGEHSYSFNWYVVAPTEEIAKQYFADRIAEDGETYEDFGGNKQGYWNDNAFTWCDYVSVCRGLVIPNVDGGAVYIDFDAENWRKKFNDFKESLVEETQCLDGDEPYE